MADCCLSRIGPRLILPFFSLYSDSSVPLASRYEGLSGVAWMIQPTSLQVQKQEMAVEAPSAYGNSVHLMM